MSITSHHPSYDASLADWKLMRDAYAGERTIKAAGRAYLPSTPGQELDGMEAPESVGSKNYQAYKLRARFPDYVTTAIESLLGIMHRKPPTIELPEKMKPMLERGTVEGESLWMLLRRINEHQFLTGRCGVLADVPDGADVNTLPYLSLYRAEDIVNWDNGERSDPVLQNLNLVVLNESESRRTDLFDWEMVTKYRVLVLGDLGDNEGVDAGAKYWFGTFESDAAYEEGAMVQASIGGSSLDKIPFVIINTKDITPEPDAPPLLGLGNICISIYRSEADYRQNLFMQGQDTLAIIGTIAEDPNNPDSKPRVGAGAMLNVQDGGDVKFVGVNATGLSEQRAALQDDKEEAGTMGGRLVEARKSDAESGEALHMRMSARTASITQIARTGAEGLQTVLRTIAEWIGEDPQAVTVEPNLEFADRTIDGDTLVKWMTSRTLGAPLSLESIHRKLQENDMTELTYEEEMAKKKQEDEDAGLGDGGLGTGVQNVDDGLDNNAKSQV